MYIILIYSNQLFEYFFVVQWNSKVPEEHWAFDQETPIPEAGQRNCPGLQGKGVG